MAAGAGFALVGQGEKAGYYGQKSLDVAVAGELPPFYLAYAYEGIARGQQAAEQDCAATLEQARSQALKIDDEAERSMVLADLDQIAAKQA